nr:YgjP-like metallopeptidase domain-containing protein [Nostoc sp. ChiSLP03a]MDZ8210794.1 DUF45 domain-containing protein [Nostoc sp. ChiSLP03a]
MRRVWGNRVHKDRVIRINWQLIDAFLSVFEHLVAHEILHRNHGDSFWQALLVQYIPSFVMPDIMYTSDGETCGIAKDDAAVSG